MCAHYVGLTDERVRQIVDYLNAQLSEHAEPASVEQFELELPQAGVDVYPKSVAPVITASWDTAQDLQSIAGEQLQSEQLQWGFETAWSKDLIFNTRIESADKPMWRAAMEHSRCLVACRWFYESHRSETTISERTGRTIKQQYAFRLPNAPIMLIGCVRRGTEFSMVTTQANADMEPVHARMPLILRPDEIELWLSAEYQLLRDRAEIQLDVKKVE